MAAVRIDSLDQEGRGVARVAGKVVFVDGALPGERVELQVWRRKPRCDLAHAVGIENPSAAREQPRCLHFERCGGCSLQHLQPRAQVAMKQRTLEENLARLGRVEAATLLPAIHGPDWGYRERARLSLRRVVRKGGVLVGFRERRTHRITDMDTCEVLPPRVSALIPALRALASSLDLAARIPQIEVAVTEETLALTWRLLDPPGHADVERLREFGDAHAVDIYLQPAGPDSVAKLPGTQPQPLFYRLPEFNLELGFHATDFTQVNAQMNRVLVRRAVALLAPRAGERIADLYCGVGNFALALARRGAQVSGLEGSAELVERAQDNARRNGLAARAHFAVADLSRAARPALADLGPLDALVLDPPRDGALALVQALSEPAPRRVVYVSCNPATLARDAGALVHDNGYRLAAAGVINMFPHTSHIESIALFERERAGT
jgi:23S rRNA (uracil1939-C5)-methyltransferase